MYNNRIGDDIIVHVHVQGIFWWLERFFLNIQNSKYILYITKTDTQNKAPLSGTCRQVLYLICLFVLKYLPLLYKYNISYLFRLVIMKNDLKFKCHRQNKYRAHFVSKYSIQAASVARSSQSNTEKLAPVARPIYASLFCVH